MKKAALFILLLTALVGCATAPSVRKSESLAARYAGDLSTNLTALAQHQDNLMSFLNNSLSLYQSTIQTNALKVSTGSLEVSHQEQVGKVLNLLASESEAHAQSFFAAAVPPAGATATPDNLAASRKAILDSLHSVSTQLTALAKGLSPSQELQFIQSYSGAVVIKVAQAQQDAVKSAQQGVDKTPSAGSSSKPGIN